MSYQTRKGNPQPEYKTQAESKTKLPKPRANLKQPEFRNKAEQGQKN